MLLLTERAKKIEKERIKNFREKKLDLEAKRDRPAEVLPTFIYQCLRSIPSYLHRVNAMIITSEQGLKNLNPYILRDPAESIYYQH